MAGFFVGGVVGMAIPLAGAIIVAPYFVPRPQLTHPPTVNSIE